MRYILLAGLTVGCIAPHAFAQDLGDHDQSANSDIVVTAIYARNQADILAGTSVLTDQELTRKLRPTIGETLSRQAGVSATSFGPNASRPVLRGFQGERVRVLSDGIGSFDVSNTSVDHAVAINPLTADRIEVLRGPAALLFGSSAIGGVVNVIDSRIPRRVGDGHFHIDGIGTYGSAANERTISAATDIPVGKNFIAHFDASYAKTRDLDTGGFILSPDLRATAAASPAPESAALADLRGKLPNSAARTWTIAGGGAVVTETGNLGFSVTRYDNLYGVPVRYSLDPTVGAEEVRLDARQTRVDLRAEINPANSFIDAIRFRGGFADYVHDELEDTGEVATTFTNQGWEGRFELVQREKSGWRGAIGSQLFLRKLNIEGEEKFLPAATTNQIGLFTVQSLDAGGFRGEIGGRYERTRQEAREDTQLGTAAAQRSFNAISASLGGSLALFGDWRVGLNLSHTQRAPSAEELFSNGPHAGTQAFEIGDTTFGKEKSNGIEATLRGNGDGYRVAASFYYSDFDNFIFETPTGAMIDDLPIFQFFQADARHFGAEVEANFRLARFSGFELGLDTVADFTRATIKGGGPIPRIPPLRLLGALEATSDRLDLRGEVEWVSRQTRIAAFETTTAGYTMVNASLAIRPFVDRERVSITLSANNILDVVARRHASFLKDYAPLSGRDIRVSLRAAF